MKMSRIRVSEKYASWTILALFSAVVIAVSLVFLVWSFAWFAWNALGYFAIVTSWKAMVVIDRDHDDTTSADQRRATLAIYAGSLVALVVSVMGFLELIQMRHALTGLASIVILNGLLRQTIGDR